MTLEEFKDFNKSHNQNYNPIVENPTFVPELPSPD